MYTYVIIYVYIYIYDICITFVYYLCVYIYIHIDTWNTWNYVASISSPWALPAWKPETLKVKLSTELWLSWGWSMPISCLAHVTVKTPTLDGLGPRPFITAQTWGMPCSQLKAALRRADYPILATKSLPFAFRPTCDQVSGNVLEVHLHTCWNPMNILWNNRWPEQCLNVHLIGREITCLL